MTYHENQKLWKFHNNHCILNSVGRGQEFIITENEDVIEWAKKLILCQDNNLLIFEANYIVSMICYRNATRERFVVRFDLKDLYKVKEFDEWKVEKNSNKVYANIGTVNTYLHRLIYGDCKGKKVLTKNGDYFDCRRENLYAKP